MIYFRSTDEERHTQKDTGSQIGIIDPASMTNKSNLSLKLDTHTRTKELLAQEDVEHRLLKRLFP